MFNLFIKWYAGAGVGGGYVWEEEENVCVARIAICCSNYMYMNIQTIGISVPKTNHYSFYARITSDFLFFFSSTLR